MSMLVKLTKNVMNLGMEGETKPVPEAYGEALIGKDLAVDVTPKNKLAPGRGGPSRRKVVKGVLEDMEADRIRGKLVRLGFDVPEDADKAKMIKFYLAEVDPGKGGRNGKNGGANAEDNDAEEGDGK